MMKSLQTYLIIIVLFFGSHLSAKAEDCCKNWLYIEFETEIQPLSGGSLALNFTVNDTLDGSETVNIDSLWYFVVNNEGIENIQTNLDLGSYEVPGTQEYNVSFNFDHENPPFYLQELRMYVKVSMEKT